MTSLRYPEGESPRPTSPPAGHQRPGAIVFSFRGHLMYKMQAGMGDTVFSPLYEVLKSGAFGSSSSRGHEPGARADAAPRSIRSS